jgi:hypothetical protein
MKVVMDEENRANLSRVLSQVGIKAAITETRLSVNTFGRAAMGNPIHAATEKVLLEFIQQHTKHAANAA